MHDFEVLDSSTFLEFSDETRAADFFRRILAGPEAARTLFEVMDEAGMIPTGRITTENLLRSFARLVVSGRIRVASLGETIPTEPGRKPETPAEAKEEPPPAPAPKKKEASDAQNVDAEAQADTLKRAAEDGTPFCEECEKARKAQKEKERAANA